MSDEINLMKAVVASPDDYLPRLVYADWLEERGKALLAEFIRTQIEIDKSPPTRPVLYLFEYIAPSKDHPVIEGTIRNVVDQERSKIFNAINTYVDWCLGKPSESVSGYWPIRGTGILQTGGAGVETPNSTLRIDVKIIPTTDQEDHWTIRDRLRTLKAREAELWQEPEVINHYNQLSNFRTNGSSHVVLFRNETSFTFNHYDYPTSYLLGLVRRGMIEEVKLPIEEWISGWCLSCDGVGDDGGRGYGDGPCAKCEGSGNGPTLGQLLVQAHPIKKVWASDRQPYVAAGRGAGCHWYDGERRPEDGVHPESNLPTEVYQKLKGGNQASLGFRVYDTELAATDDLSQALLSLANPKAT